MAGYSAGSKLLHYLALGVPAIAEASFDLEWGTQGRDAPDSRDGEHVFVSGLARAGTTILMKTLHASGEFCSLTYRDMPFVLAPNLWSKIAALSKKKARANERAHNDGILIGFDSPEALEELFWRIQTQGKYIQADCLTNSRIEDEVIIKFRKYVSLILKRYGGQRYLSKNNNNVLRIPTLLEAFPRAKVIVPFRDPLQHAMSLYRQHQHFKKLHRKDPFARRYMKWLVHHEFGLDHKPFAMANDQLMRGDPAQVDYWLDQWLSVYCEIIETRKAVGRYVILFDYDHFCREPKNDLRLLSGELKMKRIRADDIRPPAARECEVGNIELKNKAYEVHNEMKRISLQR